MQGTDFFSEGMGKIENLVCTSEKVCVPFFNYSCVHKNNKNNVWGFRGERGKLRVDWVAT